jgi:membrane-associated phospholipid phosphatase
MRIRSGGTRVLSEGGGLLKTDGRVKAGYASIVFATGVLITLAVAALVVGVLPGDVWVRDVLLAWAPAWVIGVMSCVNHAGNWRLLLPCMLLLIAASARVRQQWWIWIGLMVVAPLLEGVLKELIGRPRPYEDSFGFPSGHAAAATAYFGSVIYAAGPLPLAIRRLVRAVAAIMIVLVGLARILLRAHWPSDVLAGVALGMACVIGAALISASTLRSPAGPTPPAPPARD